MNQAVNLDLDVHEREILLRGLKFVRSSIQLAMEDPTEDTERRRAEQIQEVNELIARLEGSPHATAANV